MARTAAGVNAHINFDLPFALLAALRGTQAFPAARDSPEYRDYLQVNEIFYELLPQALDFTVGQDGFLGWLYRLAEVRDNAEQLIEIARRLAWLVCENHLWPIPAARPARCAVGRAGSTGSSPSSARRCSAPPATSSSARRSRRRRMNDAHGCRRA